MRILFTRFPLESAPGGAENQTMWLMEGLRKKGHDVRFIGSCPVLLERAKKIGIPSLHLEIGAPPVTKTEALSFLWRKHAMKSALMKAFDAGKPDAVCMLSLSEKILLTDHAAKQGTKVFWIEHDRIGRWFTKNPWLGALKRASTSATIVCVSELSRMLMVDVGFDSSRVLAIPNGVPAPSSSQNPLPSPPSSHNVSFSSQLPPSPGPFPRGGPSSPNPFSRGEKGERDQMEKTAMNPKLLEFARSMRKLPTSAEEVLWEYLRDRKLHGHKFRRQHPIHHRIVDFYCTESRLAIELDGSVHLQEEQALYDKERTMVLGEMDIRVLRLKNEDVLNDIEEVLRQISDELSSPLPSGEGSGVRVQGEGLGVGALTLGCVARLSEEKGIDILLSAIANLPEVTLRIVGKGPEEGYLRALIAEDTKRLGLGAPRISIVSSVADLGGFYRSIDALVLPSSDHDPFGLVAAEALAHGTPVIVTDRCGIASHMEHGKEILVAEAGSADSLRQEIKKISEPALRVSLAAAGKVAVQSRFSLDAMVRAYEQLLLV